MLFSVQIIIQPSVVYAPKWDEEYISFGGKCEFDGRVPGVFTWRPTDLFEKYANAK